MKKLPWALLPVPKRATGTEDATVIARSLWKELFDTKWPSGWKVKYTNDLDRNCYAATVFDDKTVWISTNHGKRANILHTLVHEFIHMGNPNLRHNAEFYRMDSILKKKLNNRLKKGIKDVICQVCAKRELHLMAQAPKRKDDHKGASTRRHSSNKRS